MLPEPAPTISPAKVVAVIVAYGADQAAVDRQLNALTGQVSHVIVVVNPSSQAEPELHIGQRPSLEIELIKQACNVGLPAAQNIGIDRARVLGASSVLFLDQDSIPQPDMVSRLSTALQTCEVRGDRIAAVGPVYEQPEGSPWRGFVTIGWTGFRRNGCASDQDTTPADFLISSGTLVRMAVLDEVGLMDGSLFIDHADTEWCLRARSLGYGMRGVCGARMQHTLGDHRQRIWWFGERAVSHHAPFRHYYMFRNSILLCRRAYIPLHWKIWDAYRSARLFIFMALFARQKRASLTMMLKGWSDGLKGVTGPMPLP